MFSYELVTQAMEVMMIQNTALQKWHRLQQKQLNQQFLNFEKEYIEHIVKLMEKFQKPIFGVSLLPAENNQTLYRVSGSEFKGVFYPTPERAVKSFAKMVEYNRFLKKF